MIVNVKERMFLNKYKSDVLWRWIYLHNESSYYAHLLESSAYNFQFSGRWDWGTNLKGFNREILLRAQKSIKVGVLQRVHNCRGGIDKKRSLIKAHLFLIRLSWDQANFFTIWLFNNYKTFHGFFFDEWTQLKSTLERKNLETWLRRIIAEIFWSLRDFEYMALSISWFLNNWK